MPWQTSLLFSAFASYSECYSALKIDISIVNNLFTIYSKYMYIHIAIFTAIIYSVSWSIWLQFLHTFYNIYYSHYFVHAKNNSVHTVTHKTEWRLSSLCSHRLPIVSLGKLRHLFLSKTNTLCSTTFHTL